MQLQRPRTKPSRNCISHTNHVGAAQTGTRFLIAPDVIPKSFAESERQRDLTMLKRQHQRKQDHVILSVSQVVE